MCNSLLVAPFSTFPADGPEMRGLLFLFRGWEIGKKPFDSGFFNVLPLSGFEQVSSISLEKDRFAIDLVIDSSFILAPPRELAATVLGTDEAESLKPL